MLATSQSSATVGVADSRILGSSLGRRRLTISPPSAGRVTIFFNGPAVLDAGETIFTASQPRTWDYRDVGDMICGEVHAIADAGGRVVGILEAFEPGV